MRSLLISILLLAGVPGHAGETWVAVSWHDVRDDVANLVDYDQFAISTSRLAEQFDWIYRNGWQPVSVDQIIAARNGGEPLPEKAVLLSFDDGLASLYHRVFPLLEAYQYPAVAALVTGWLEQVENGETVDYEGRKRGRDGFVRWDQLRAMVDSGLVELASHSHRMHRGIPGNPQGNTQPAATTLAYLPNESRYETGAEWRQRVRRDLAASIELIESKTDYRPRTIVWPYGEYNDVTERIAHELGLVFSLGLTMGLNDLENLKGNHRLLVSSNARLNSFINELPQPDLRGTRRAAQVDLDFVYDQNPAQQEANLDLLIERIHRLDITSVWLQAFSDPDGDGAADELYFPNRHLPMRADLFNRVAWQLRTRAGVEVFAWMPVLAFELPDPSASRRLAVAVRDHGPLSPDSPNFRLSPFLPEARRIIGEIYTDLARQAHFDGVLYHDDAWLSQVEDLAACNSEASWPGSDIPISDCNMNADRKSRALVDMTHYLTEQVRQYRPAIRTARNLFATVLLDPSAKARFGQDFDEFLVHYDYTVVMAMPRLEGVKNGQQWLLELVAAAENRSDGLAKSIFELQAKDWNTDRWIDSDEIRRDMRRLIRSGVVNLAYYPDDFINGKPDFEPLFQGISHRTFPFREKSK